MTSDEVRLLDNKYALLFVRGERPIMDLKYDILKHPNVALTTDGKGKQYIHGSIENSSISNEISTEKENNITDDKEGKGIKETYKVLTSEELEEIILKEEL